MAKKLIRLTENDLHKVIKESVIKVLKENTKSPLYALARYLGVNPKNINSNGSDVIFNVYLNNEEQTWYVFESFEEAENYVREISPDWLDGSTSDDYFYSLGYDKTNNGDFDWVEISNDIINNEGIEWFLSSYDGTHHDLPNGYVAFRID